MTDKLLICRVPGYTQIKTQRKAVQKEKFIFYDLGVRNGILKIQNNKFSPEQLGHLFEQWIVLQIITFNSTFKKNWNLFYYRDDKKIEVDLIIQTTKKTYILCLTELHRFISFFACKKKLFYLKTPL